MASPELTDIWRLQQMGSYLFMYFGPAFDFGHNHSHYLASECGSEGEELFVGGDILIP